MQAKKKTNHYEKTSLQEPFGETTLIKNNVHCAKNCSVKVLQKGYYKL